MKAEIQNEMMQVASQVKRKKKCIIFVRVSTEAQSWTEQRDELVQLAKSMGYKREDMYIPETKVVSGINAERIQIRDLETRLETGEYDCVFVQDVSRISRRKDVIFQFECFLVNRQIQLVIKKPFVMKLLHDDRSVDVGVETIFTLFAQISENEMRQKKERFHRRKMARVAEGRRILMADFLKKHKEGRKECV